MVMLLLTAVVELIVVPVPSDLEFHDLKVCPVFVGIGSVSSVEPLS